MNQGQQINLYTDEFRHSALLFSSQHLLIAMASAVFIAFLLWGWTLYELDQSEEELAALTLDVANITEQVEKLRVQRNITPSAQLQRELDNLKETYRRRQQVLQLIERQNLGNAQGFSGYLVGFAKEYVKGIQLQTFDLDSGGGWVSFSGTATHSELVPRYLGKLRKDEHFAKARMGILTLVHEDNKPVRFSIADSETASDLTQNGDAQ
ncbi:hypothetical protein [Marinibactrum halimedae]|uniref:Fimbrial assembly protein n=1 Tax=Marinibactrum halimedae TaxID=1444977 RepID=A0AA37T444_9GAMM|nr:hypothetical protein [Marinibactrum halimedae]MCD9460827.1 hypothetical protein [Marinibactrum halimedae]GLS26708.1 hypothetical protein GCM10007877_24250 [Marinibactrum halimedae]